MDGDVEALLTLALKLAPGDDVPEAEANFCTMAGDVGRVGGDSDGEGGAVTGFGPNRSLTLSNSVFQCGMQSVYSRGM
jgi:hypothetical protein